MSEILKLLCSFGGRILQRPGDGKLRYIGRETHIISIRKHIQFELGSTTRNRKCKLIDLSIWPVPRSMNWKITVKETPRKQSHRNRNLVWSSDTVGSLLYASSLPILNDLNNHILTPQQVQDFSPVTESLWNSEPSLIKFIEDCSLELKNLTHMICALCVAFLANSSSAFSPFAFLTDPKYYSKGSEASTRR
ncbi:hypothetical protein YC2023_122830 [Brassica napus]